MCSVIVTIISFYLNVYIFKTFFPVRSDITRCWVPPLNSQCCSKGMNLMSRTECLNTKIFPLSLQIRDDACCLVELYIAKSECRIWRCPNVLRSYRKMNMYLSSYSLQLFSWEGQIFYIFCQMGIESTTITNTISLYNYSPLVSMMITKFNF